MVEHKLVLFVAIAALWTPATLHAFKVEIHTRQKYAILAAMLQN